MVALSLGWTGGQAPQPHSGAPEAQGLTARTSPKRSDVLRQQRGQQEQQRQRGGFGLGTRLLLTDAFGTRSAPGSRPLRAQTGSGSGAVCCRCQRTAKPLYLYDVIPGEASL